MPDRACDGQTEYTCEIDYTEEKGEVRHWHGLDREDVIQNFRTRPPDFVFPFERKTPHWTEECECPRGCVRFTRGSTTLRRGRTAMRRLRLGAGGTIFQELVKVTDWQRLEVKFVCATVEEEETSWVDLDPDGDLELAMLDAEPGFKRDGFSDPGDDDDYEPRQEKAT